MKKSKDKVVKKHNFIVKEDLQKIREIIKEIEDDGRSDEFKFPVDYKSLGLEDYPSIITNPMDLSTVKKKIKNNKYMNVEEVLNDIQLIWDNCKKYNTPGSEIYNMACDLENLTKKSVDKILKMKINSNFNKKLSNEEKIEEIDFEIQNKVSEDFITYNEKNELSEKIKKINSNESLSSLVSIVNSLCQRSIENIKKDQLQIRIDKFDRKTYEEVNKFLETITNKN